MSAEFDQYAATYREIINGRAAFTGETFEYFIDVRLKLVEAGLAESGRPTPTSILDFGCGIGATAEGMRRRFPHAALTGIDVSGESIKAAESLGVVGATFFTIDSTTLPLADQSVDLVYSNGTFHHIEHGSHPSILREVVRVLRPGGTLFIFENNPLNPLVLHGMHKNPFDAGTRVLMPWYLRRLVSQARLQASPPQYYVFFPAMLKGLRWAETHLRRVPLGAQYFVRGDKAH